MKQEDSTVSGLTLRDALERVTDGIAVVDTDLRYTAVNEAAASMLGRTPESLRGASVRESFEDGQSVEEALEAALTDGRPTTLERYDAERDRWLEVRAYPDDDGLSLTLVDVTERKQREWELERFRAFVESSSDTISVVDEEGVIRYVSEAAGRDGGVPPEELVGTDAFERVHPDDRDAVEQAFERALVNPEENHVVQYRGRRDDGDWVWLESACVNRLDDGDVEGLVVVTRDVTERKRREQERATLTEEYRAVFDNADDVIFLVDVESADEEPTFRYVRVGPAHQSQTGPTTAELDGKTPREALGAVPGTEVARHYRQCVEEAEPITYQEVLSLPDGERTWQTKLAPVVVDDTVTRIVGIARDVTERVEYERELHRKNERLDEFASVVSHDIRNPLSVALGRVQLLEEEVDSEHLPPIVRSLLRIEAIVDDTLTLARQGETVAETEPISISGLVGQCWGTVDVADATLEVADEFTVHGDRSRLRQVFENLFNNSVTHGGSGVTVRVGRLGDDGIYVEDDGPGIPESERETVFEPGHKSSAGGTGFGLTIVRRIVEAHGWRVTVTESTEGGARFEFHGVDVTSDGGTGW